MFNRPIPECAENEYKEVAWGIKADGEKFAPVTINRPKVGDFDVKMDMLYCGICHSDVHIAFNQLGGKTMYPCVPGHELVGKVVEVGPKVTKVKVGDHVGCGCIVDSCLDCEVCTQGDEQYCLGGKSVHTYNDRKRYTHIGGNPDTQTFGGYSGSQVIHEHFAIKIPEGMDLKAVGPLLCAGITMYDPLKHWGATNKDKKMTIGIIGIGGLGSMGIKLAKALGHKVVAISTSANKMEMAKEKGADDFVVSKDPESMKAHTSTMDLILNTVSASHQASTYIPLLGVDGTLVQLGLVLEAHAIGVGSLYRTRKTISGSHIGGIASTQECIDLCHKANIYPDVQLVEAKEI